MNRYLRNSWRSFTISPGVEPVANDNRPLIDRSFLMILIIAVALRTLSFYVSGDYPGDAASRAALGLGWLRNPSLFPSSVWLPLHFYLIGGALFIWNDVLVVPRALSLVFGILTFLPFYGLVRLEFGKNAALISTLLLSIYPLHIRLSVVSMAEVPFFFFLLSSLYFFLLYWKEEQRNQKLAISAILLNFACMIRLEGWFFIPVMAISLLYKRSLRSSLLFLIVASILPTAYVILCKLNLGVWFPYLELVKPEIPHPKWTIIKPLKWIWPVSLSLTPIVALLSGIGLLISIIRKSHLIFALFIGALCIPLARAGVNLQPRYALYLTVLLLPFFIIGYRSIKQILPFHRRKIISVVIISLSIASSTPIIMFSVYHSTRYSPFELTPSHVTKISKWLKDNVKNGEPIILDEDKDTWWSKNIILMAGLEGSMDEAILQTQSFTHTPTWKEILHFIENEKPRYLVYSPRGELPDAFSLLDNRKTLLLGGQVFKRIPYDDEHHYHIFEITTVRS